MAVKVTLEPVHIMPPGFATILTFAGPPALTVIVIELEVAGEPEIHVALEVIIQVIISPFDKVVDE